MVALGEPPKNTPGPKRVTGAGGRRIPTAPKPPQNGAASTTEFGHGPRPCLATSPEGIRTSAASRTTNHRTTLLFPAVILRGDVIFRSNGKYIHLTRRSAVGDYSPTGPKDKSKVFLPRFKSGYCGQNRQSPQSPENETERNGLPQRSGRTPRTRRVPAALPAQDKIFSGIRRNPPGATGPANPSNSRPFETIARNPTAIQLRLGRFPTPADVPDAHYAESAVHGLLRSSSR